MTNSKTSVFALYPDVDKAETAVNALVPVKFAGDDVSVVVSEAAAREAMEGPLGVLEEMGPINLPGVGALVAAGPIRGMLTGVATAADGLAGALVALGVDDDDAKRYEAGVKDGSILLSVVCRTPDEVKEASQMLKETGGATIVSAGERPLEVSTESV